MTKEIVIVSGVRTPVGRYMGALKTIEAYDLAALVLNEAIKKAGIKPDQVDEVIMGQSYQNGEYVNIARMGLLNAGWPEEIPGLTIDRRCCTGLETIRLASALIQSGQAEIIVAGGVESMSNAEFYLPGNIKWGVGGQKGMPRGHGDLGIWGMPMYDRIQRARVMSQPESRYGILPSMMSWAETGAKEEGVTREECDEWALGSHQKACAAQEAGKFDEEMIPITIPQRKGDPIVVDKDENPRPDSAIEKLARLKPVLGGVCTAGNSSTENDGAAAVVVMTAEKAKELGLEVLASVKAVAVAGADPTRTYLTVGAAARKALAQAGVSLDQMELIEIQEAFAAQVLADLKDMGIGKEDYGKINVNGSGISLGHPIAATGVRVLVSLVYEMRRREAKMALECICGGGGLGIAAVLERK
ncbi:acetyl-CoA C-acetyltransferase [Desulfatibacillum alkenivorans DSM 16219]|jgi:acetyl-CoA C-acetyltransferase|uniref:Acetyl-CoA C-acetyltransferase n=1 Tax=Desulfatibacillum alkenivorans DSM 16219 TaxID=1121393 RepID=A0A1M6NGI9_9BACT|nr:acetyl-CoA C-acyltransferase [Desulfatibacillum alkenivorans]SHJ94799.1 acetyl-CoA C-acetyltransferase [Desulfatibacillum alkenivorans DSM 16219]